MSGRQSRPSEEPPRERGGRGAAWLAGGAPALAAIAFAVIVIVVLLVLVL